LNVPLEGSLCQAAGQQEVHSNFPHSGRQTEERTSRISSAPEVKKLVENGLKWIRKYRLVGSLKSKGDENCSYDIEYMLKNSESHLDATSHSLVRDFVEGVGEDIQKKSHLLRKIFFVDEEL
jgi:hypothetical protein